MAWGRSSITLLERLAGAAWAARQIHDKLVVPCSHNPSGERRPGSLLHAFRPHQFRKTRDFLIDNRARSLRGNVARSKPSAAGGEDGITIITVRPGQKRAPNAVHIVRQDLERLDLPASLFKQLANCRAGPVFPAAHRCGITQHENSCAKGHKKLSAVSFQLSGIGFRPVLEEGIRARFLAALGMTQGRGEGYGFNQTTKPTGCQTSARTPPLLLRAES